MSKLAQLVQLDGLNQFSELGVALCHPPLTSTTENFCSVLLDLLIGERICDSWAPKNARINWESLKPPKWWEKEFGDYWEWDPGTDWPAPARVVHEFHYWGPRRYSATWWGSAGHGLHTPADPVALVDAGGYRHWCNPIFDGLPWLIDVPMVASEWIGFVPDDAEYLLAECTAKYAKQRNQPKDQNLNCTMRFSASKMSHAWSVNSATKLFQKDLSGKGEEYDTARMVKRKSTDTHGACTVTTRTRDSLFEDIVPGEPRFAPNELARLTRHEVAFDTPEHWTPGEDCFSEPPRPREGVGWRVEGKGIYARHVPAIPGGRGGAAAKTQIKEKDFVPAELPSESERRWWEDRINQSISDFAAQHPDEAPPIVRQDRHGNLAGQHFNMIRRTTTSVPQRRQEVDKAMRIKVIQQRMAAGENSERLERDLIVMRSYFGETLAEVGRILGKGKEAMKKRRQRLIKEEKEPWMGMIGVACLFETVDPGWYLILRPLRRPVYIYKIDARKEATEAQLDEAVNVGARLETARIFMNEVERVGTKKMTTNGVFNDHANATLDKIRDRTYKAFKAGDLVYHESPAVMSPLAARVREDRMPSGDPL